MASGDLAVKIPFIGRDEVSKEINKMRGNMRNFGDTSKSVFRHIKKDALSVRSVMGGMLGARAVTASIGFFRNQVSTITDELIAFDHAATKAAARYGFDRNSKEFKQIGVAARETGAITKFTAAESAKAIDAFAMSNFELNESLKLVQPTAKLAMAADLELADSADIAASSIGIFRKEASDFGNVADVLAFTANKTKTNLAEMFEGIKQGGGIFKTVESDVGTFSAFARALGDVKIVGSRLGTQMATAISRIVVGGKGADKARKALGLDKFVKDSEGNVRDLVEIIGFMEKKLSKMGTHKRLQIIRQVGGLTALEGVNALLTAGADKLTRYREEARNSMGYVEDVSGKMALSYENKIKEIQSALVEAGFQIVEKYGDDIPKALDFVIEKIRNLDTKKIQDGIQKGLDLSKQVYKIIKESVPYLKTIAIIWAGFKVTAGLNTMVSTINHMREAVFLFNSGIDPIRTKLSDVNKEVAKLDKKTKGLNTRGLSSSIESTNAKALGLINTLSMAAAVGFGAYKVADEFFKKRDEKTERHSKQAEKSAKEITMKDIAGIGSMEEASEYLTKLRHAEYSAKVGGTLSRENVADSIGAFFSGQESNFEKQERLVKDFQLKRSAVEKVWDTYKDAAVSDIQSGEVSKFVEDSTKNVNLNNKVQVETVVRFDGNVPENVSAESKTTAPPIDKKSLGVN